MPASIEKYMLADDATVPNNPRLPVLVYRQALEKHTAHKADRFKEHFKANGWAGIWTDSIYTYRHFHTNAHEVLGIAEGSVTLEIGGKDGKIIELNAGDLIILPAGTAHKRLSGEDVVVVGGYPKGQENYDICRDLKECGDAFNKIACVELPDTDPLSGNEGQLNLLWKVTP